MISAIRAPDAVATVQRTLGLFETAAMDAIRERLGDCPQAAIHASSNREELERTLRVE